ncbi:MAG: aminotransferase class I/II-fold pyridoxal phosphate-dependent enzyme [Bacteroidia bacterium]|nr:aminotransferase class I/II-fold pyridoxal phosphate-dependent enzyme [Bacteroidia bacterium]
MRESTITRISNEAQSFSEKQTDKSKYEQSLDIIDQVTKISAGLGVAHLSTEDYAFDGQHITVNGKRLVNFGSCSYLGLELDPRLKAAAIQAVERYGSQFSSSRAYVSVGLYEQAERLLSNIFSQPINLAHTTTLGHLSNIPVIVGDKDAVILDSQVHNCVSTTVDLLKNRGIPVFTIRHNRMDVLEDKIKRLRMKHKKIWYMADGVYSMFGDFAPAKDLERLMNLYEQFYCYIDDAHGMSWAGNRGSGYILSQIEFHPKLFLTTGLAKGFGACGGVMVFPDQRSKERVRNCGRTMIFSGPIQPAVLGSLIASAKIHLSQEVYTLQTELQKRIRFFNDTARLYDLPLLMESNSPIFFVGVGKAEVGYNMVSRLVKKGHYVNLSVFPSVAYKNTGLRIPLTLHNTEANIESLLRNIAEQLPFALKDEGSSMDEIYAAFNLERS